MIIGHANKHFDFLFRVGVGGMVVIWMILSVCVFNEYFTACWFLN